MWQGLNFLISWSFWRSSMHINNNIHLKDFKYNYSIYKYLRVKFKQIWHVDDWKIWVMNEIGFIVVSDVVIHEIGIEYEWRRTLDLLKNRSIQGREIHQQLVSLFELKINKQYPNDKFSNFSEFNYAIAIGYLTSTAIVSRT